MAKGRIKVQEGERLDDAHLEKAIAHLEAGGSKKDAYDILNIKANPTRLTKIIEQYREKLATAERIRKANRGKPASNQEVVEIIKGALEGEPISKISEELYRSTDFVKRVIETVGIPQKQPGSWYDRRYATSIPDQCMSNSFEKYELVWSDKYQSISIVLEPGHDVTHIYVIEKIEHEPDFSIGGKVYTGYGGRHAWQRNEELGSLKHLQQYGIDLYKPYRPHFPNWIGERNA